MTHKIGSESRKRPSGLLRKKPADPATSTITARNSSDSPFLRLPPELRNRIYRLVLGDRAIHVCSSTLRANDQTSIRFCKRTDAGMVSTARNDEPAATVQTYSLPSRRPPLTSIFEQQHSACLRATYIADAPVSQAVAIVLVFASHYFCLHGIESLEWIAQNLAPCQLRAISSITISLPARTTSTLTRPILRYLSGVRSLAIIFEVEMFGYPGPPSPEAFVCLAEGKWGLRKLATLVALEATKVEVMPFVGLWEREPLRSAVAEALAGWAKRKEEELMHGR